MIIRNRTGAMVTVVSNRFIDEYISEANGEFVKVYLYLLRLAQDPGAEVSITGIADRLNHTEKDVLRALRYWEKQQWLTLETDGEKKISGISLQDPAAFLSAASRENGAAVQELPASSEPAASSVQEKKEETPRAEVKAVSPEVMARLGGDEAFSQITFVAEQYLGRTLTPKDMQLFAYLYEELHFSEDLLEYLVEYCVGGGHRSSRYMETVALGWHQEGMTSVEKVKESHRAYSKENKQVMKAFGITGRILNDDERGYVEKWTKTYGLPLNVVAEGCRVTVAAIQKPSFQYTDRILTDWYEAGVKTLEESRAYRENRKNSQGQQGGGAGAPGPAPKKEGNNRFQNYQQRNIDYDALLNQGGLNPYGKD